MGGIHEDQNYKVSFRELKIQSTYGSSGKKKTMLA